MLDPVHPPPLPSIPPTAPGPLSTILAPRPPVWPTVVGVFAIIFGIGGMLVALFGFLGPLITTWFQKLAPQNPTFDAAKQYELAGLINSGVTLLLATLLLVGGILLYRRRPAARPILIIWSILKILASVGGIVLAYFIQQAQFDLMATQVGNAPQMAIATTVGKFFAGFFLIFALLWAWAFPVFLLIWLNRRTIRDQIAAWPPRTV